MSVDDPYRPARRPASGGGSNFFALLVAVVLGVLCGAVLFLWMTRGDRHPSFDNATDQSAKPREADPKPTLDDDEKEAINVFKGAKESVVNVDQVFSRRTAAVIHSTITLARDLDMLLIAEGVESLEQVALLQALGCEAAQGYLFARPVSAHELADVWLDEELKRAA